MDYSQFVEWGLAGAMFVGAKLEMKKFRVMFKETLDKLCERIDSLEERVDELEEDEDAEVEISGFRGPVD